MTLREMWERITLPQHTRALEASAHMELDLRAEIVRLRAENRALLNSILGIAGVPPLPVDRGAFVEPQLYPERDCEGVEAGVPGRWQGEPGRSVGAQHAAPVGTNPRAVILSEAKNLSSHSGETPGEILRADTSGPQDDERCNGRPLRRTAPRQSHSAAMKTIAVPMRRRSWQQINRMLEFESARKKEPEMS